jgi:hypothetical protein
MIIDHLGKSLEIDFSYTPHGKRVRVAEYVSGDWVTNSNSLYPLSTEFECLTYVASDLFGESIHAEDLAHLLNIPIRFSDDADCVKCGAWYHYEEMISTGPSEYVCINCDTETEKEEME